MLARRARCTVVLISAAAMDVSCGGLIAPDVSSASDGFGGALNVGGSAISGTTSSALAAVTGGGVGQTGVSVTQAPAGGSKAQGGATAFVTTLVLVGGSMPTGGAVQTGGVEAGGVAAGGVAAGGVEAGGVAAGGVEAGAGGTVACAGDAPCGGDLDGSWSIVSSCSQGDLVKALNGRSTLDNWPEQCSAIYTSYDLTQIGTMTFAAGTEIDQVELVATLTLDFDATCLSALFGQSVTPTARVCRQLQSNLVDGLVCSVQNGSSCVCGGTVARQMSMAPVPYHVAGNQVTYDIAGAAPIDYCVSGTNLTMYQSTGGTDPATVVLTLVRL